MAARTKTRSTGKELADLITAERIKSLSGSTYFKRGEDYFRSGAVFNLSRNGEKITAKVVGTHTYKVSLWKSGNELEYSCNCPLGYDEEFCKHCVATALAWIAKKDDGTIQEGGSFQDIRSYLASMKKDDLVALVVKYAEENDDLRRSLVLAALRGGEKGLSLQAMRDEITSLTEPALYKEKEYDDYYDDYDYYDDDEEDANKNIESLNEIISAVSDMLKSGSASKEVLDLVEHGIIRLDHLYAVTYGDSGISRLLKTLFKMHSKGYKALHLGSEELAERTFDLALSTDQGIFAEYHTMLGKDGMNHLARLVREHLEQEEQQKKTSPSTRMTRLMDLAGHVAAQMNDTDLLILVKRKSAPSIKRSRELIELYTRSGRTGEAIMEAEEGIRMFESGRNSQLADFLVRAYTDSGEHWKAIPMLYTVFVASQNLGSYRRLRKQAELAGAWDEWKPKAFQALKERERKTGSEGDEYYDRPLVDLLLADKDYESAWQEALEGGCSRMQWLALAEGRARTHPEDSIAVYTAQIEALLPQSSSRAYEEIIRLLRKTRDLMDASDFEEYLDELHDQYKSRRKFTGMLDENFPRRKSVKNAGK